jgi:iron-sulfur cluster assembly protein
MSEINFKITPAAIAHIKRTMANHGNSIGMSLSMRKYGCNGFGYVPEIVSEMPEGFEELKITPEFRVFVDPNYATYLHETTMDYVGKGLGQQQLVFNNPNAKGECGCGESVNFEES